jgi:hypothetical protein
MNNLNRTDNKRVVAKEFKTVRYEMIAYPGRQTFNNVTNTFSIPCTIAKVKGNKRERKRITNVEVSFEAFLYHTTSHFKTFEREMRSVLDYILKKKMFNKLERVGYHTMASTVRFTLEEVEVKRE